MQPLQSNSLRNWVSKFPWPEQYFPQHLNVKGEPNQTISESSIFIFILSNTLQYLFNEFCIGAVLWGWLCKMTLSFSLRQTRWGFHSKRSTHYTQGLLPFIYLITLKYCKNRYNDLLLQRQFHARWFQIVSNPCQLWLVRYVLKEFERCSHLSSRNKWLYFSLQSITSSESYLFGDGVNRFPFLWIFSKSFLSLLLNESLVMDFI